MNFSKSLVETIDRLRFDNEGNDEALYVALSSCIIDMNEAFGKQKVAQEISDLAWLYDDSDSNRLKALILECQKEALNTPLKEELTKEYKSNGILARSSGERVLVIHPNNRAHSKDKYPIQMSEWIEGQGVIGDRFFNSIDSALDERDVLSSKSLPDDELYRLESNFVESQSRFESRSEGLGFT